MYCITLHKAVCLLLVGLTSRIAYKNPSANGSDVKTTFTGLFRSEHRNRSRGLFKSPMVMGFQPLGLVSKSCLGEARHDTMLPSIQFLR